MADAAGSAGAATASTAACCSGARGRRIQVDAQSRWQAAPRLSWRPSCSNMLNSTSRAPRNTSCSFSSGGRRDSRTSCPMRANACSTCTLVSVWRRPSSSRPTRAQLGAARMAADSCTRRASKFAMGCGSIAPLRTPPNLAGTAAAAAAAEAGSPPLLARASMAACMSCRRKLPRCRRSASLSTSPSPRKLPPASLLVLPGKAWLLVTAACSSEAAATTSPGAAAELATGAALQE